MIFPSEPWTWGGFQSCFDESVCGYWGRDTLFQQRVGTINVNWMPNSTQTVSLAHLWQTFHKHCDLLNYSPKCSLNKHLILPIQALCQQPSIILTLIQYLVNTFTKVLSQHFAAQNTRKVSPSSPDMPEGRFSPAQYKHKISCEGTDTATQLAKRRAQVKVQTRSVLINHTMILERPKIEIPDQKYHLHTLSINRNTQKTDDHFPIPVPIPPSQLQNCTFIPTKLQRFFKFAQKFTDRNSTLKSLTMVLKQQPRNLSLECCHLFLN